MAIIKCPECGHQVSDQAKTCPSCGIEIAGKVVRCPECGEIVFNNLDVCPGCHHPLHVAAPGAAAGGSVPRIVQAHAPQAEEAPSAGGTGDGGKAPSGKKTYTVVAVSFVLVLIAVFVGLYFYMNVQQRNEQDAYDNAMLSEEPAVLQNYLDMYADAPAEHRDSIAAHLERLKQTDLEWNDAVVSGSKTALERYVRLHPGSMHIQEAKIKIDSLDWIAASTADTPEAYQAYVDAHADGMYVDEARDKSEKLEAMKVGDADRQRISALFTTYFNALAEADENGLTAGVDAVMTSFLHRANATKSDVIAYMHKLHADEDIAGMTFRLNNDWKIVKNKTESGDFEYAVSFSVDNRIDRTDESKDKFITYKVEAVVSPEGKISSLNMKKVVQ